MSSILDSIIDATEYTIISEQHDFGRINVEIPDFDGTLASSVANIERGSWDAREYGISAEQAIANLKAADTPEARAKVMAEMKERALRRFGVDKTNGRISLMVAGKPAWSRLGVNVSHAVNSRDAINLSNTNWLVEKVKLAYDFQGSIKIADNVYAIVRKDTGAMLGHVGSRYEPIQNQDGFEFLDTVLEEFGARYESAGAIHGGKQVWMLANLPKHRFTVNGRDNVESYVQFSLDHSGKNMNWCFPVTNRTECANTFRLSMNEKGKGIGIRHTGNVKAKINDARRALGLAVDKFEEFEMAAKEMAHKPMNIRHYARDVLDAVLDITEANAMKGADILAAAIAKTDAERRLLEKSFERKIERRGEILGEILERYESSTNGIEGMRGTAWACFNAITETADHGKVNNRQAQNKEVRESRRFESIMTGELDNIKQVAFAKALA